MSLEPLNSRDVHIGVTMADGATHLVRKRNPHQVAWELHAARKNLPTQAGTLALTYQAWHALKAAGDVAEPFDQWAEGVDEVYPADPAGDRLAVDPRGRLARYVDDDELELVDDTPDPTQPAPASGI